MYVALSRETFVRLQKKSQKGVPSQNIRHFIHVMDPEVDYYTVPTHSNRAVGLKIILMHKKLTKLVLISEHL